MKYFFAVFGLLVTLTQPAFADCHTDTAVGDNSTTVRLNELYPIPPSDEEEFIELYNNGSAVNLAGWVVADASGKSYTISADDFVSTTIKKNGYFVIPQSVSKIYLNNSGDSVYLYQPDNTLRSETTYEDADDSTSWAYSTGDWTWSSTVTDGEENIINGGGTADDTDEEVSVDYQTSTDILVNELLPNPAGLDSTDEWIEIVNTGSAAVNLTGWQLTDRSSYYTIDGLNIGAGELLVFEVGDTGINLNNSGDSIFLIDPFEAIIDGVEYSAAEEGASWARFDDGWQWTSEITPGEANILTAVAGETSTDEADNETAESLDVVNIELFRSLDDGQSATIQGVVTVLPDVFASQYFYIQDDNAGIQVYSYNKLFPGLTVGDVVTVTGEKSTARGETRIKTQATEDIVVLSSDQAVLPRDSSGLDESLEGMLVQIEGSLTDIGSSGGFIEDVIELVFKDNALIDHGGFEEGVITTAVGIVQQSDDKYKLLPRATTDLTQSRESGIAVVDAAAAATETTYDFEDSNSPSQNTAIMLGLIAAVLAGAAYSLKKKHQDKNNEVAHTKKPLVITSKK